MNRILVYAKKEVLKMVKLSHKILRSKIAEQNWTQEALAEILDISVNRVYYLLRRNKTKLDTNTKKHDYDEIISLKESGLKPKEISEKLDIPLRTVYYILNKK